MKNLIILFTFFCVRLLGQDSAYYNRNSFLFETFYNMPTTSPFANSSTDPTNGQYYKLNKLGVAASVGYKIKQSHGVIATLRFVRNEFDTTEFLKHNPEIKDLEVGYWTTLQTLIGYQYEKKITEHLSADALIQAGIITGKYPVISYYQQLPNDVDFIHYYRLQWTSSWNARIGAGINYNLNQQHGLRAGTDFSFGSITHDQYYRRYIGVTLPFFLPRANSYNQKIKVPYLSFNISVGYKLSF